MIRQQSTMFRNKIYINVVPKKISHNYNVFLATFSKNMLNNAIYFSGRHFKFFSKKKYIQWYNREFSLQCCVSVVVQENLRQLQHRDKLIIS